MATEVQNKTSYTKEVRIFPYKCKLNGIDYNPETWNQKFDRENVSDNIIEHSEDTFLVVVVDEISTNFVFGRFLKLRNDSPAIINRKDGSERTINLLDEENIREQSHFIMNSEDKFIFAEYNFRAIRHFKTPFAYYLDKIFDTKGNEINPLSDTNTFSKLQGKEELNVFKLKVAQENIKFLEEKFKLTPFQSLLDMALDKQTTFEIIIRKSRKRNSKLNKERILKLSKDLKDQKAPIEELSVASEDILYDLINNNLLNYRVIVKRNGRALDSDDFYFKTRNLYDRQIDNLKDVVKKK